MCAGMMSLTWVSRTVYGQKDPSHGNAMERLKLDSKSLDHEKGYKPYPKTTKSEESKSEFAKKLNKKFDAYKKSISGSHSTNDYEGKKGSITAFLFTNDAKSVYKEASAEWLNLVKTNGPLELVASNCMVYVNLESEPISPKLAQTSCNLSATAGSE